MKIFSVSRLACNKHACFWGMFPAALGNNVRVGDRRNLTVYFISILLNRKTNIKTYTEQKKHFRQRLSF
jgi:hypothetical protein